MYEHFFSIVRLSVGVMLLLLGIIGLLLPFLQSSILIVIAIPLISPTHGKRMADWLRKKLHLS
ncbi:hypothetical protein CO046_00065 [Candidatus Peregrinibacteria bacterium CG_4_9_14_0_2_um_filter_53_11]|nr:MAG: hypothetical protein CO046_00065 [Candidatus Peregrinibacteria bacterium CG_4_9_14_0_2_um_filter_53_11]